MEEQIGWFVPALGIPFCWYITRDLAPKSIPKLLLIAFGIAIAGVVGMTFVSAFANGFCIELGYCDSYGDRNMEFWFQSIWYFPAYLFAGLVVVVRSDA